MRRAYLLLCLVVSAALAGAAEPVDNDALRYDAVPGADPIRIEPN